MPAAAWPSRASAPRGGDKPRMDAVMYCLDGLKSQQGLPVNDPTHTYPLRSLAGEYTALHLVSLLHVGIKQFDPSQGAGFDIDREYEAALALYRDQGTATAA